MQKIFAPLALASLILFPLESKALSVDQEQVKFKIHKPRSRSLELQVWKNGKMLQSFPGLGSEMSKILFGGKEVEILETDLDRDGQKEALFRTEKGLVGALWVLRWNREKQLFDYVRNEDGDRYVPVPTKGKVELTGQA